MGPVANGLKEGFKSQILAARFAANSDPSIVDAIKREVKCEDKKLRNVAVKILSRLAGHRPDWLLDELDFFLEMLQSDQNIMKWAAMDVVGYLAELDQGRKIGNAVIELLIASLEAKTMVTAAHGVDNLVRIARVRPELHSPVLAELFRMESIRRPANCREVLLSKVADGLGRLLPNLSPVNHAAALTFLSRVAMTDGRAGSKAAKVITKYERC